MRKQFKNDQEIINAILRGGESRNRAISQLYENAILKQRIINHVLYFKGNEDDGKSVFVESLIIMDRNIRHNKFHMNSSLDTYHYSIAKLYWKHKLKKSFSYVTEDESTLIKKVDIQNPELMYLNKELRNELSNLLDILGEKCKQILKYWSLSYSYEEISKLLKLGNANAVRKQKYYCRSKLLEKLKENPDLARPFRL